MTFNQREKILIGAALAVLGLLVADRYALSPLLEQRDNAHARRDLRQRELDADKALVKQRESMEKKWRSILDGGLKKGRAEAEGQILRCLRDWAEEAGVRLSSLRLEYPPQQSQLPEIIVNAVGTGSMRSARDLLWRIESTRIPVRIKMLQLGSRKDGTDDLTVHIRVSTLYRPETETPPHPTKGVTRTAARARADRGEL